MQDVLIGSATYQSYASLSYADEYLAAALHADADWSDATDDSKGRALVTMTRILDRQRWASGYATQAERAAVDGIVTACIEGALALLAGSDFQSEQSTAQKLESLRAGSVTLTYFRGAEGVPHRFPQIVHELLRDYLAGSDQSLAGQATGTAGTSSTEDDFGHTGGL